MGPVSIVPVLTKRELTEFIDYPYRKYKDDEVWVAPLRIGEFEKFDPAKNPYWDHADRKLFLARAGDSGSGKIVGRIAFIDDHAHNQEHDENTAFFGFFEAEDEAVARTLLGAVESEARTTGRSAVRGPLNPSMNDGSGFQIDAFDEKPFVMMPQNPAAYPVWVEGAGYQKVKDLFTFYFDNRREIEPRLERIAQRTYKRNDLVVRPADLKQFDREVKILKHLHTTAWEKNWGNVPYSDAEMDHLASEMKMILNPELAIFAEIGGEPIGMAVALPDINQVFSRFNGRLLPVGIFHLLRRKQIINRARLVMLGVLPQYRNRGLEMLLIYEIVKRAAANGIVEGECGWTLENNHSINSAIEAAGGVRNKTYRLFQKEV